MNGAYAYTPYIWPMLASPALLLLLAAYSWRHRPAPGARAFSFQVSSIALWAVGSTLAHAAGDPATKVRWLLFQGVWLLPAVTAALWFALEYAGLGHWLTRPTVALLAVPPAVALALTLAPSGPGLLCSEFWSRGEIRCVTGPVGRALVAYGYALAVASSAVFLWLFVRSPLHRWPAALCLCGHAAVRLGFIVDTSGANPFGPLDATLLGSVFAAATYAAALFGFHMFELIPVARGTVFEQMQEGVLVLDRGQRVVDLNPAAGRILGRSAEEARGRPAPELLPSLTDVTAWPRDADVPQSEVTLAPGGKPRRYALELSALRHRGGFRLGYLAVLHDVTEQREAQAGVLEQQRALATLQERDRVARELHDSLGQVLGYAKMQAQAARERLARREWRQADEHLAQLVAVAQDAHADVREYILGARTGGAEADFLPSLEDYLRRFRANYAIAATLEASPGFAGRDLEPMVGVQLLRILQEALTNVRKHARARAVRIDLSVSDGSAQAVVEDDGAGFDAARPAASDATTFGLGFMRERAQEVGGTVEVHAAPGEGTRVVITVPLQGRAS